MADPTPNPMDITVVKKHDLDVAIEAIASKVKSDFVKQTTLNNIVNGTEAISADKVSYSGDVSGVSNVKAAIDAVNTAVGNAASVASTANTSATNANTAITNITNGTTKLSAANTTYTRPNDSPLAEGTNNVQSAIDSIATTASNAASSASAANTAAANIANGTTVIAYTPGGNTDLTAANMKSAIDQLGVRTNSTNLQTSVNQKVDSRLSNYNFSINGDGELILTIPNA